MKTDYKILTLCDGAASAETIDCAKRILCSVAAKSHAEFTFDDCSLSDICTESETDALEKAKRAHAVLYAATDDSRQKTALTLLRKSLGLYAETRRYNSAVATSTYSASNADSKKEFDFITVCDAASGICFGEQGYSNNPSFGREAYDVERYSELEIERVARVAYELADRRHRILTLADKADSMTTSKLWRKIVTDINEDYPYVRVDALSTGEAAAKIVSEPYSQDVILTSNLFGSILNGMCSALADSDSVAQSSFGETALGIYGVQTEGGSIYNNGETNPCGMILACADMLKNSFDLQTEADIIEKATIRTMSQIRSSGSLPTAAVLEEIIKEL